MNSLSKAEKWYGHKPSESELFAFMLAGMSDDKGRSQNDAEAHHGHVHTHDGVVFNSTFERAYNALEDDLRDTQRLQETQLYLAASRLEAEMALAVEQAIRAGELEEAAKLISEAEEKAFIKNFMVSLSAFYLVLYPIYANQLMQARARELDQQGVFAMTEELLGFLEDTTARAAESHVSTVKRDLIDAVETAWDAQTNQSLLDLVKAKVNAREASVMDLLPDNPNDEDILKAVQSGKFDDQAIYAEARRQARMGGGLDEIARAVHKKYENISRTRATTIARHETNRVFNMAQYQADVQFLTEANLMGRAYKVLRNRADDPCEFCAKLIDESRANPIPFTKNFADLGEVLTVNYTKKNGKMATKSLPIDYEPITAGNVHVNCRCEYELIVKNEDGTVMNMVDLRVDNRGYNPYRDPKTGRFTFGSGKSPAQSTGTSGIKKTVLQGMVESAKENGGMTTNIIGDSPTRGIAFAPRKDTEKIISGDDFNEDSLDAFIESNKSLLQKEGMHIGGWFNEEDGKWYLDISKVGEYNSSIIKEAQDAEQLAVYDLSRIGEDDYNGTITGEIKDGKYIKAGDAETIFAEAFGGRDNRGVQGESQENSISQEENGKVDSSLDDKAENGPGYNPNRDPKTGEFTFGSGSGGSRSPAQAQKLSELENSIRSRKTERFYAVDDSGEVIAELDGNENTVKIDFMTAAKIAGGKNVVLTHNHPPQGHRGGQKLTYPFSKHDLQAAAMMNPKTIRAVGDTHEYELTRNDKWGAPSALKRAQTLALKKVDKELWTKVNAREMTREMASFERHHLALQEVAKKFDLMYERTERSE